MSGMYPEISAAICLDIREAQNSPELLRRMFNYSAYFHPSNDLVQMECPFCEVGESECLHFGYPHYKECDDGSACSLRGDCLRIPMHCEAGHVWRLCFGFHKGAVFVFIEASGVNVTGKKSLMKNPHWGMRNLTEDLPKEGITND